MQRTGEVRDGDAQSEDQETAIDETTKSQSSHKKSAKQRRKKHGDDVALNEDCGAQTHLFEDRVMKIGEVTMGDRICVGSRTIILYNSMIEDDVKIEPLSLVMKGETLQKDTTWVGSPVAEQ